MHFNTSIIPLQPYLGKIYSHMEELPLSSLSYKRTGSQ